MSKVSLKPTNDFCPQTLFLYGTYDVEKRPDFGLFCWFSYTWDGELGVMCCIGGDKLTKENIHRNRIFSASLVTEELLPIADYFGTTNGHDSGKMNVDIKIGEGQVLPVPIVEASPVVFELEVKEFVQLHDGEVIVCKIRNVLQEEALTDPNKSAQEKLAAIRPVKTTCQTYFGFDGSRLGAWGEPGKKL